MDSLHSAYNQHGFEFWLALLVLAVLIGLWTWRTANGLRRLDIEIDDLFHGLSGDNTANLLTEYLGTVRSTAAAVARMQQEHTRIAELMPSVVRHVGLVRFSPFHDTGGDQSFALAVLDGRGDGVIITGLHSRHDSRLYAKPIEGHGSRYALTPEEREAMNRALRGIRQEVPS